MTRDPDATGTAVRRRVAIATLASVVLVLTALVALVVWIFVLGTQPAGL